MKKVLSLIALLAPFSLFAQWSSDPAINTPVCTTTGNQSSPEVCADNSGGAFIVWEDRRNGTSNFDIYIQHLDSTGTALWTANGIPVCIATGTQANYIIIPDGSGGCYILWRDSRSGASNWKIYAQHFNAAGTASWTTDGIELASTPASTALRAASDNNGGVIFCWTVNGAGTGTDILAQRINSSGNAVWTSSGITICNANGDQPPFGIVADSEGNAVIAWTDLRNGSSNTDLFAQRISAAGNTLWANNGMGICEETHHQNVAEIIPDQNKGVIVSWQDERLISGQLRVYAQHLDSTGAKLWATDGLAISNSSINIPVMTTDNAGGAIMAWYDTRNFYNSSYRNNDIYAQRVNGAGVTQWTADGVVVCNDSLEQSFTRIISDGNNGAVMIWIDVVVNGRYRAQRIDGNGNTVWPGYLDYCTVSQRSPRMARSGNNIIITWSDIRAGSTNENIYATRFSLIGSTPIIPLPVDLISFTGQAKGNQNLLTWTTATENNNAGFAVERSNDAIRYSEIGFVKGAGNSVTETSYHFMDEQPINGKNFYRLKQTDKDGKSKYSSVVELQSRIDAASILYPNPAGDEIKIVTGQKEQLHIVDVYGRNVLSSFTNQSINIAGLKPGHYYCKVGSAVLPFVKK